MKEQIGKYSIAEGHTLKSISEKCLRRGLKGTGFITFRNNFLNKISQRESQFRLWRLADKGSGSLLGSLALQGRRLKVVSNGN
jgi:hypothetical protein